MSGRPYGSKDKSKRKGRSKWSLYDVKTFRSEYHNISIAELSKLINKSRGSINDFARELGIIKIGSYEKLSFDQAVRCTSTGVYMLFNEYNGKMYIGSSDASLGCRIATHFSQLKNGTHYNKALQQDWEKDNHNFHVGIVKVCGGIDTAIQEQKYIVGLDQQKLYNVNCNKEMIKNISRKELAGNDKKSICEQYRREIIQMLYINMPIKEMSKRLSVEGGLPITENSIYHFCKINNLHINRKRGKIYECFGVWKNIREWEKDPRMVIPTYRLRIRLKNGWDIEEAITTPHIRDNTKVSTKVSKINSVSNSPLRKLSNYDVVLIRELYEYLTQVEISKIFDVTPTTISLIFRKRMYKHLN